MKYSFDDLVTFVKNIGKDQNKKNTNNSQSVNMNFDGVCSINGKKYFGQNIKISGNKVYIDGTLIPESNDTINRPVSIIINGNCSQLENNTGEVTVNGNVEHLKNNTGNIQIFGETNTIDSGSGDIKITQNCVTAKTNSGNIKISGSCTNAKTNSGNISKF